jgi:hypothetical protein
MSCSNCNKPAPNPLPDTWAAGNDEVLCPGCFEQLGSRAIEYSYRDEHGAQIGTWRGSPAVALQAAIEHLGAVRLFAYRDKDGTVWCLTTEVLMALGAALRAGVDPDAAYDSWCHDADCVAYPDGDVGQLLADEEVCKACEVEHAIGGAPWDGHTCQSRTEEISGVVTSDGRCAKCGGELPLLTVFEDSSATFSFCPECQPEAPSSKPASPPPDRPGLLCPIDLTLAKPTPPFPDLTPRWSSRANAAIDTFIGALVDASGHDPEAATLVEIEDLRNELLKRLGPLITHVRIAERLEPGPFSPDAHAARLRGAGKIGVLQGLYMEPDIYMVRLPDEPKDDPVAFYLASELELRP